MIAQGIRSVSVNPNNFKSTNSNKEVEGFSFDNFINNNLKADGKEEKYVSRKQPRENLFDSKRYSKEDSNIQKTGEKLGKTNNVESQKETAKIRNNINNSANVKSETSKVLKDLEDTVKKTLNLTDEDFEKAMETLGLTTVDLLNIENLKLLFLKVNGADDITQVLTNENLANAMDRLLQMVNELKESNGLLSQADNALDTDYAEELMNPGDMQKVTDSDDIQNGNEKAQTNETVPDKHGNPIEIVIEKEKNVNLGTLENNKQEDVIINVSSENQNISSVAEDSGSSTNSNFLGESSMKNDSIQELIDGNSEQKESKFEPLNDMNSFIHNLAVATLGNEHIEPEQVSGARMIHNIASQILEQLKVSIKPDFTSMEFQLNPEHLGKVGLSIISKDGVMTAQFTAQNEMAKEAIQSQMHVLIENLNNQGLKVESIEVAVSNFAFGESNQTSKGEEQQSNSQNRNHFRSDEEIRESLEGVSGFTDSQPDIQEQNGSIIDYSA